MVLFRRVLSNVGTRTLTTRFLGCEYGLPLGIAPMGMCNLACPDADAHIARIVNDRQMPVCLSSAGSFSRGRGRGRRPSLPASLSFPSIHPAYLQHGALQYK